MHPIKERLLELARQRDLAGLSLRQIGALIGERHPQKVKHHLNGLQATAALRSLGGVCGLAATCLPTRFRSIPVLGAADCGPATFFAEQKYPEEHIQVSSEILASQNEDVFCVRAMGDSMNQSCIGGCAVEHGDYVLVDPHERNFCDGDYVLSVINDLANIKKVIFGGNGEATLVSESSRKYPPIYVTSSDLTSDSFVGKVVRVFKKPQREELVFEPCA